MKRIAGISLTIAFGFVMILGLPHYFERAWNHEAWMLALPIGIAWTIDLLSFKRRIEGKRKKLIPELIPICVWATFYNLGWFQY